VNTQPQVMTFFDNDTFTASHLVVDPDSRQCAIIDSVLDYCPHSGCTGTANADRIIAAVTERQLQVQWILETHVHADHLSAAPLLQQALGGQIAIGDRIGGIQQTFAPVFNTDADFACDGSQFDQLLGDDEAFTLGKMQARALHTPGHTPACMSYLFGDALFVGDTLFMPDYGSARCDFPGGDAATLYRSVQRLYSLPGNTRMFLCHDYGAPGREEICWETTVTRQRENNVHLNEEISEQEFIAMRQERDAELDMPRLIMQSVQVNMRGGQLPAPESNGIRYLKIPVNAEL
jgi:glyoxylase-like metal-dependent hydrolase (beta-lactamase superfamily II)